MPFAFLSAIKTALGDVVQFVDDSDFLDEAKAIKSPAEIEMIRRAARLQDEVFATVVANQSDEHTPELQSLMRISYALPCSTQTTPPPNPPPPPPPHPTTP